MNAPNNRLVIETEIDVQEHVDLLRAEALDRLSICFSVAIFFLVLAFLYRLTDVNWKDIYFLHHACFVISILVVALSKRLPYKVIVSSYLGLGITLAASEYIGLGITGLGGILSLSCLMISLFYLDKKSTFVVSLLLCTSFSFAFYQYAFSGTSLSENDLSYVSLYSSWIEEFISVLLFFVVIGMSIHYLQAQIINLLGKVELQKRVIEDQNQRIEYYANHDVLTGLPSLRIADERLEEALKQAEEKQHKSALLFLDLDNFKAINDSYGHEAGDEVLKIVSGRILPVIRSNDTACRIGGDEFLVIIEKIEDQKDLEGLCKRLIKTISAPLVYDNTELCIGVSIGAAIYPCSAKHPKNLRRNADQLMYQAKESGKNNYKILKSNPLIH